MKLKTVLVGKSAFEHVYGKGAIEVQYIIIIYYYSLCPPPPLVLR
jgi:hypothetical protein